MSEQKNITNNKNDNICFFFFTILFLVILTICFWPMIKQINTAEFTEKLSVYLEQFGVFGWIILFVIQVIQVVIAIIPGGPFEIVAGMLYGPWIGSLILTIGGIFASSIIFSLCKKYGRPFILKFFKEKHIKEWSWIEDSSKLDIITFIVYLIPGTPKDMLTYFLGTTSMSIQRFLLISNLGRIPALFVSCALGSSIGEGNYRKLIILTIILVVLVIFSFLFREQIFDFYRKKKCKNSKMLDIKDS